jgi:protein TonB
LNNPAPSYPKLSRRLNEQGQVVIRVYVAADGSARQVEIKTSSGYDRLDQEALRTVMRWRFVPGQHLGVPEAMWFNVPVNFVLD